MAICPGHKEQIAPDLSIFFVVFLWISKLLPLRLSLGPTYISALLLPFYMLSHPHPNSPWPIKHLYPLGDFHKVYFRYFVWSPVLDHSSSEAARTQCPVLASLDPVKHLTFHWSTLSNELAPSHPSCLSLNVNSPTKPSLITLKSYIFPSISLFLWEPYYSHF